MQTHKTTCKIGACEPFCGLEVDVEDGTMVAVRPDRSHPISKGYACIKGMRVLDYQNDPDRLLHPVRRNGSGWDEISWGTAANEIGSRLRSIRPIRSGSGPRLVSASSTAFLPGPTTTAATAG